MKYTKLLRIESKVLAGITRQQICKRFFSIDAEGIYDVIDISSNSNDMIFLLTGHQSPEGPCSFKPLFKGEILRFQGDQGWELSLHKLEPEDVKRINDRLSSATEPDMRHNFETLTAKLHRSASKGRYKHVLSFPLLQEQALDLKRFIAWAAHHSMALIMVM